MRYFGLLVVGFCFFMSGLFVVQGLLRITSPDKALAMDRFFIGKKRSARYAEGYRQTRQASWAVIGGLQILFGLFFIWVLVRSLTNAGGHQ
ncbi:MAG: hypothetical protein WBW84_20230 [Acidobacteriaceae bacterium]